MPDTSQYSLVLILARQLAGHLATPMVIVDATGTLAYFNEAAERLLGQSYRQLGPLSPEQMLKLLQPEDVDGGRLETEENPLVIAVAGRRANHREMAIRAVDGTRHRISCTAYPLMETAEALVGAVAIFWAE